jgi:hypothetical protein
MLTTSLLVLALAPAAHALDHGPWQRVLDAHLDSASNVDYAAAKDDAGLEAYVASLATAPAPSGKAEQLAFWMNAYNALTVDLIADEWPLGSIRDLDDGDPWGKRQFTVAGKDVTLNDIEHKILRPLGDARIHAGVNCASKGCPPLHRTAFTAGNVEAELDKASGHWAGTTGAKIDRDGGKVLVNKIFDWYGDDFLKGEVADLPGVEGKQEAALVFLMPHLSEADQAWLKAGGYAVDWRPYSWRVNAQ